MRFLPSVRETCPCVFSPAWSFGPISLNVVKGSKPAKRLKRNEGQVSGPASSISAKPLPAPSGLPAVRSKRPGQRRMLPSGRPFKYSGLQSYLLVAINTS